MRLQPARQILIIVLFGAAFVLFFLSVVSGFSQAPADGKSEVPSQEVQKRILADLKSLDQNMWQRADTDMAARLQLVSTLLARVEENTIASNSRFVHLKTAAELAAQAGDFATALESVRTLEKSYRFEGDAMRAQLANLASAALKSPDEIKVLIDILQREMATALDEDNYALAANLGSAAEKAAMRTKDLPLVLTIRRQRNGIFEARKKYAHIQPFAEKLKNNPMDEKANLEVGKYLCLQKGDWERGLYYLAQSSDPALRLQAQRDLIRPETSARQIEVGDRWWKFAEAGNGHVMIHLKQRAVHWYEQALYDLKGEQKKRLEERIASVPSPVLSRRFAWDHSGPPGLIRIVGRHGNNIFGVTFSPDGKRVLAGSINNMANVWDVKSAQKLLQLQGHQGMIWDVAYGPNGKHLFTASWDGSVKMWNAKTGAEIRRFPAVGRIADINGIAVSPDGKKLLAGSDDTTARIWDVQSGKELMQLRGHRGIVYGVAFSPDGRFALTGGGSDRIMIYWDLRTGKSIRQFQIPGQIRSVAFSPDGRHAVAAGETTVRLWNLKTGQEIRRFNGHTSIVYAVAFSPDGRRIATAGQDRTIRYWDVATGRQIHVLQGHASVIYCLAFSPGGGRIVSGSADNTVRLWGLPRR